jgi:hypothetical protein
MVALVGRKGVVTGDFLLLDVLYHEEVRTPLWSYREEIL